MTTENIKEIISYVIKNIESLKAIKHTEDYSTISSDIRFKGNDTGKLVTINVKINEDDSIEVTGGDAPFMKIVQEAVKDFYNKIR